MSTSRLRGSTGPVLPPDSLPTPDFLHNFLVLLKTEKKMGLFDCANRSRDISEVPTEKSEVGGGWGRIWDHG